MALFHFHDMGIINFISKTLNKAANVLKSDTGITYSLTDRDFPRIFLNSFGAATPKWLQFRTNEQYILAWEKCPPLVSVLIAKAQADINGKVSFYYKDSDEPVRVPYNGDAKKLQKLFKQPNPLQTWKKFRAQQKIYQSLFGFCPVLMVRPAGFNDRLETTSMWNIPPQFLDIELTGQLIKAKSQADIIKQIKFTYNNTSTQLPVDDVLLLTDSSISLVNEIIPDSRLRGLEFPISNIASAYEAENVIITKRGALGILSNKSQDANGSIPLTKGEKEDLQKDFSTYGLSLAQSQIIITSANLQWQQMTLSIRELMLHETINESTQQVCDTYGYPYELMANTRGVSFANKKEAKKTFYQDTVIPEANSDFESYNIYFLPNASIELYYDFDHVEALQTSEAERSLAMKNKTDAVVMQYKEGVITKNRMREILNEKTVPGDDTYYTAPAPAIIDTNNPADPNADQSQQNADEPSIAA